MFEKLSGHGSEISGQKESVFPSCFRSTEVLDTQRETKAERVSPTEGMSLREKQETADQTAQEYNAKFHPYERGLQKGIDGITKTPNGGVSFENSSALYKDENGKKSCVDIEATGSRSADFDAANKAMGLKETPEGNVWHHLDNYDVATNKVTMQLVKIEAHNVTKPHSGGCAQYDAVHGAKYNPQRRTE